MSVLQSIGFRHSHSTDEEFRNCSQKAVAKKIFKLKEKPTDHIFKGLCTEGGIRFKLHRDPDDYNFRKYIERLWDDLGGEDDKFIDIRTDAEKKADEEPDESDPRDDFGAGVEGDETGRNIAYNSFKKVENSIIDSYELLSNPEDQELFYDYLIANLKLYFDKFEGELAGKVDEPSNQAYDTAKQEEPAADAGGGEEFDLGGEEELELEL